MGYQKVKFNHGTEARVQTGPSGPVDQQTVDMQGNLEVADYHIEPAEVIDIILNADHDNYDATIPDPEEQYGFIKVRR